LVAAADAAVVEAAEQALVRPRVLLRGEPVLRLVVQRDATEAEQRNGRDTHGREPSV
jgi:hypothetical protein